MTDTYVQDKLTAAFLELNESSGKPYIKFENGKAVNVYFPNTPFTAPTNKQYFVLSFLPGEPEAAGMGTEAYNSFVGVFQIDIYSPAGKGEDEVNAKYEALSKLFERGKYFDRVLIRKVYCPTRGVEIDAYRAVVRINWTAQIPK
jgi:hypothetical protein